jgi:hypothetical protein
MKKKRKKGKPKQSQQSSGRSVAAQPLIEALFVHAGEQFKSSGGFKTTVPTMEKKKIMDESIFEIKNVLSEKEAGSIIEAAEKQGFVNSFQRETRECAHRDNGRIQFYSNIIAESMWDRISPFLPENINGKGPTGLSNNFRLYKYEKGQRFGQHIDESVQVKNGQDWTLYTLLIYLNGPESGLRGGETFFYEEGSRGGAGNVLLSYSPKMGHVLCHIHGEFCLLHEGGEVTSGVKYLMRTDVTYA